MSTPVRRPTTAYFAFAADIRASKYLSGSVTEQARQIAAMWAELPAEEKKRRSELQRGLLSQWKSEHAVEKHKPEAAAKHVGVGNTFAFKLFCVKALDFYKQKTGKDLPYTLKVRAELERQFYRVQGEFQTAASDLLDRRKDCQLVSRSYAAWAD